MVSPAQMQDANGDGEEDQSRPQIGSVGFVIGTRSLCVYTPLGWIDVKVGSQTEPHAREDAKWGKSFNQLWSLSSA